MVILLTLKKLKCFKSLGNKLIFHLIKKPGQNYIQEYYITNFKKNLTKLQTFSKFRLYRSHFVQIIIKTVLIQFYVIDLHLYIDKLK